MCLTSLSDGSTGPPTLPCTRDDTLVDNDAAAPKPCLPPVEMRTSTAAGGLLPTDTAFFACFCRLGTRGICEMISDGGRRFIPADVVGVHILYVSLSSQVAHDRATEDNHTQERNQERTLLVGTVSKPRQGGINSVRRSRRVLIFL